MNCPLCSADEKRGVYQCPQCKRDIAEDLRAALLQVEALKKDVLYHSEAGIEAEREKKAANLQLSEYRAIFGRIVEIIDQEDSEGDALLKVKGGRSP